MRFIYFAVGVMIFTAGCASSIQSTSGAAYLAGAERAVPALANDQAFQTAANVEPLLVFPARIGLARIEAGRLVDIPAEELDAWHGAFEPIIRDIGEVAPVNLFIADLVAPAWDATPTDRAFFRRQAIERIRLAAARQHLDAVLVYETHALSQIRNSKLALADLTLIGAYLAPGRRVHAVGAASALLFDVRNNYPYASATTSVDEKDSATAFSSHAKARDLEDDVTLAATTKLAIEIAETTFPKLASELGERSVSRP